MINDLPAHEEAELRRAYTTLQKNQGGGSRCGFVTACQPASFAHSGIETAKQQMSLKDAEDTGSKTLSTKSWRRGMWSAAVKKGLAGSCRCAFGNTK